MSSKLAGRATAYLAVRPLGVSSWLTLYSALFRATLWRLARRPGYVGPGQFLKKPIRVIAGGSVFELREASDDLEYVLPGTKLATTNWFRPGAGENVVDVGAHIGFNTLKAASRGARVVALEPNPKTFQALRKNLSLNRAEGVKLVRAGAGSSPGDGDLRVPLLASGFGSFRPDWVREDQTPDTSPVHSVGVRVIRIDDALAEFDWPIIDWLLVDVEGSELDALLGAPLSLVRARNVIIEVDVRSDHPTAHRIAELLQNAGLTVIDRLPQYVRTEYWYATRQSGPR